MGMFYQCHTEKKAAKKFIILLNLSIRGCKGDIDKELL